MKSKIPESMEKSIRTITIPPCPAILVTILNESRKSDPDPNKITDQVCQDPGLAASVLKLVNSLAFRRGNQISSIRQAVSVLGTQNTLLAMYSLFLRNSVEAVPPTTKKFLESFWEKSGNTANTARKLASMLPGISADDAYILGLFHDCGIPILMQRYPQYEFDDALNGTDWENVHVMEEEQTETNHAIVGNLFAHNWGLPNQVCKAILHHHDIVPLIHTNESLAPEVGNLIAVLILAEHLVEVFLGTADGNQLGKLPIHARALQHLGIEYAEFNDMALDILGALQQERE